MTAPLAHLPPVLAARLANATPPPAARPASSMPPGLDLGGAGALPPGNTWKVAVGISAVAVAASLAGAGYWFGARHGSDAEPPPSSSDPSKQPAAPSASIMLQLR